MNDYYDVDIREWRLQEIEKWQAYLLIQSSNRRTPAKPIFTTPHDFGNSTGSSPDQYSQAK